jgi:hypothetical protein
MMRALALRYALACSIIALACAAPAAAQQAPAPAAAPATPAAAPAQAAPAQPSAPETESAPAPDSAPAPAPDSAATSAPAPAPAAAPQRDAATQQAADHARVQAAIAAQLAAARAQRAKAPPKAPKKKRYGDAGAPFAIGGSLEWQWYPDASYDLFSDDDVDLRGGAWLAYDVAELRRDVILAVEAGWQTEHAEQDARAGTLKAELTANAVHGGVQIRAVPVSWLEPHLRIVGGASFASAKLHAYEAPRETFKDHGVSAFGSAGLGFTLRTPTRLFEDDDGRLAWLSLGLMVEGGYTLMAPLDLSFDGPGPDSRAIALADADAGTLKRSGPYIRTSFVVRF